MSMNRIYVYNVIILIKDLSNMRYNIIGKPEHHDDFIMTGKIEDNIFIASKLDYKKMQKKLNSIFAGGDFILFDMTKSVSDGTFVIDTVDEEIGRLNHLFGQIRKANDMVSKDQSYFGAADSVTEDNEESTDIPTLNELLDKIADSGLESLNTFEKKLLDDYSK